MAADVRNHPAGEIPPPVPQQMEVTLALRGSDAGRVERRGNGEIQNTAARAGKLWLCPIGMVEDSIRIIQDLGNILHDFLAAHLVAKYADAPLPHRQSPIVEHAKMRRVIDYINDNLASEISL